MDRPVVLAGQHHRMEAELLLLRQELGHIVAEHLLNFQEQQNLFIYACNLIGRQINQGNEGLFEVAAALYADADQLEL